MKKTLLLSLLFTGSVMLAGEPFLLNTPQKKGLEVQPNLFGRKKAMANENGESNIAIKMNLTQLALRNLSFQAEYGFHNKLSVCFGVSSLLKQDMPLYSSREGFEEYFSTPTLKGFAVTPEFRFYPGGKDDKPAPRGFYLAAYLRYAKYTVEQTVSYEDDSQPTLPVYTAISEQTYKGYNAGLMIGHQWIIANHVTIDWWIVGGGYGKAKYTYSWMVPGATLTQAQQDDVREQAEAELSSFQILGLDGDVKTTPNSVSTTITGLPMFSLRFMGLCIGYAF